MIKNHSFFIGGIIVVLFSFVIKAGDEPYFLHWGFPVYREIWIVLFAVGLLFSIGSIFIKPSGKEKSISTKICPNCMKLYSAHPFNAESCENCAVQLEKSDGFFERHPDLNQRSLTSEFMYGDSRMFNGKKDAFQTMIVAAKGLIVFVFIILVFGLFLNLLLGIIMNS